MTEITFEQIGLTLQILGVVLILGAQILFLWKLRKKWKDLKIGFLDVIATRLMPSDEELRSMSESERKRTFEKFPLALWLRSNFAESIIGLLLTLVGLLVELLVQGSTVI